MDEKEKWHSLKVWDKTYLSLRLVSALKDIPLSALMDRMVEAEVVDVFGEDESKWPQQLRNIRGA